MKPNSQVVQTADGGIVVDLTMKHRLYAIKDAKAGIFNSPIHLDNDAVAIRAFGDMVTDTQSKTLVNQHPSDFVLCYVGDFDIELGTLISPEGGIKVLACGSDYAKE